MATMQGGCGKGHRKFALAPLQKLHPYFVPSQRETKSRVERSWGNAINRRFPMTEQTLDRPAEAFPATGEGGSRPADSEAQALIPGWRCLPGAVIRAYGEEGPVDLAALHPARGVALIAFLDDGQEASPEEARDALQVMLRDEGLSRRFPGELPIVALPVPHSARSRLAATVERAFSGMPAPTLSPGWVDWVAERLAAKRPAAAPALRLLAPRRDEAAPDKVFSALLLTPATEPAANPAAPRLVAPQRDDAAVEKPADGIVLAAPMRAAPTPEAATPESAIAAPVEEPPVPAENEKRNWLDWGATLGFALGMVAALIAGLTAVLRNGRLF